LKQKWCPNIDSKIAEFDAHIFIQLQKSFYTNSIFSTDSYSKSVSHFFLWESNNVKVNTIGCYSNMLYRQPDLFDLTICKCVLLNQQLYIHKDAIPLIKNNTIGVNGFRFSVHNNNQARESLRRLIKYNTRGFKFPKDIQRFLINALEPDYHEMKQKLKGNY